MIDYIDIKKLGFKKVSNPDTIYENQYGRPYWWMQYEAAIAFKGGENVIMFNWDCDKREIKVFINEKYYCAFNEWKLFRNFFDLFSKQDLEQEYNFA